MRKVIALALMGALGVSSLAHAQVKDSSYKDWTVYTVDIEQKKTCYIASFPKSKSGNFKKRDDPYFMVTYIGDDVAEVSTSPGFKFKSGSRPDIKIGNKKLSMFTNGELAWANDRQGDKEFITVMKKQNDLTVKSISSMGSYAIDKYSLNGFSAAYERMKEACK